MGTAIGRRVAIVLAAVFTLLDMTTMTLLVAVPGTPTYTASAANFSEDP